MAEDKDEKEKDVPQPKAGPNIIVVIGVLLAIQALVAFAVVTFALPRESGAPQQDWSALDRQQQDLQQGSRVNIADEIILPVRVETVVSVAGTQGERFLKARIALAYDSRDPANKRIETALLPIETQIRSKINEHLSSMTWDELQNLNARNNIRISMLNMLNATIPTNVGRLSNVYIEEFLLN